MNAEPFKLKYYMFDWDNNVLHMPTRIYLERKEGDGWVPQPVSTAEFAEVRNDTENYRPPGGDWDKAFVDFDDSDEPGRKPFLEDTREALDRLERGESQEAPSFEEFKDALIEGRLFAIITARSHGSDSIREAVEYFIERMLTDQDKQSMMKNLRGFVQRYGDVTRPVPDETLLSEYLDLCRYWGVSSEEFRTSTGLTTSRSDSPELAKQVAIKLFVTHVVNMVREEGMTTPVSVGFSDDDPDNLQAAEAFLREELVREFPDVKFVVYDTSDPDDPDGKKMVIEPAPSP